MTSKQETCFINHQLVWVEGSKKPVRTRLNKSQDASGNGYFECRHCQKTLTTSQLVPKELKSKMTE